MHASYRSVVNKAASDRAGCILTNYRPTGKVSRAEKNVEHNVFLWEIPKSRFSNARFYAFCNNGTYRGYVEYIN